MTIGDRERLLGRIRQIRRSAIGREQPPEQTTALPQDAISALETRMAHLEQLLEGLQDSVHREFERHDDLITTIQREIDPGTLGASLAEDARNRGL